MFKHAVHSFLVHMALSAVEVVIVYVCLLVHLAAYRCHLLFTACGMSTRHALNNFKLFLCIYIHFFIEVIYTSEKNINYWPLPSSQSIQYIICLHFFTGVGGSWDCIWRIKGCTFYVTWPFSMHPWSAAECSCVLGSVFQCELFKGRFIFSSEILHGSYI